MAKEPANAPDPKAPEEKRDFKPAPPPAHPGGAGAGAPADPPKTAQEADDGGGKDHVKGVGPVGKSQTSPGPAATIEDLGIGPREPYPTGSPPESKDKDKEAA